MTMDSFLQQLISFDQSLLLQLNGSQSLFWDRVMVLVTSTWVSVPMFVVLLYVLARNCNPRYFGATVLAIALTILACDQVASGICKPLFQRFRPTQDPSIMYFVDVVDGFRGGRYGFMSSHASNTFGLCVFLSLFFRYRRLTILLIIWATLSTYSRIYLGVHYIGDVLFGCFVGCLFGYIFHRLLIWRSQSLMNSSLRSTSFDCTSTGVRVSDINWVILSMLFTYAVILIIAVLFI